MKIIKNEDWKVSEEETQQLMDGLVQDMFELSHFEFRNKYEDFEVPEKAVHFDFENKSLFSFLAGEKYEDQQKASIAYVVNFMAQHGGDVNSKDKKGRTPLIKALENNNYDYVKLLLSLENSPDVNLGYEYEDSDNEDQIIILSPLHFALRHDRAESRQAEKQRDKIVGLLVQCGAKFDDHVCDTFAEDEVFKKYYKRTVNKQNEESEARLAKLESLQQEAMTKIARLEQRIIELEQQKTVEHPAKFSPTMYKK